MLNRTIIQGRLCEEPILRYTQTGTPVCSFRVAWSEKYKESESKLFLSCTVWRSTAEMMPKYFFKGQELVVEGKLITRDWTDRDGNKRQTNELRVDNVNFCGSKSQRASEGSNAPEQSYNGGYSAPPVQGFREIGDDEDDGSLPF